MADLTPNLPSVVESNTEERLSKRKGQNFPTTSDVLEKNEESKAALVSEKIDKPAENNIESSINGCYKPNNRQNQQSIEQPSIDKNTRRRNRIMKGMAAASDAISAITNLYYTTQGAPSQNHKNSMLNVIKSREKEEENNRKKAVDEFYKAQKVETLKQKQSFKEENDLAKLELEKKKLEDKRKKEEERLRKEEQKQNKIGYTFRPDRTGEKVTILAKEWNSPIFIKDLFASIYQQALRNKDYNSEAKRLYNWLHTFTQFEINGKLNYSTAYSNGFKGADIIRLALIQYDEGVEPDSPDSIFFKSCIMNYLKRKR